GYNFPPLRGDCRFDSCLARQKNRPNPIFQRFDLLYECVARSIRTSSALRYFNLCCCWAFLTCGFNVRNALIFLKGLVTVHLDFGVVSKKVFTTIFWGDKTKAFFVIKPL